MLTEDLGVFFQDVDFAQAVTYKAGGVGGGTTVYGIFDNPDATVFGMSGTRPSLLFKASDIASFGNTDTFTIGSTVYRGISNEPIDDGAIVRIMLEKQ